MAPTPQHIVDAVSLAMALLWEPANRSRILSATKALELRASDSRAITSDHVTDALRELHARGDLWMGTSYRGERRPVEQDELYLDFGAEFRLKSGAAVDAYRRLLSAFEFDRLEEALYEAWDRPYRYSVEDWPHYDPDASVALFRLRAMAGVPWEQLWKAKLFLERRGWSDAIFLACLRDFDPQLGSRMDHRFQGYLLAEAIATTLHTLHPQYDGIISWGLDRLENDPDAFGRGGVQHYAAVWRLWEGRTEDALRLVEGLTTGLASWIRASSKALDSRWEEAGEEFEAALREIRKAAEKRKGVVMASLAWLYPLTLLALHTPKHLEQARKFCQAESGTSKKDLFPDAWLLWTHAIQVRLGSKKVLPVAFQPTHAWNLDALWRLLLRTWLGEEGFDRPGRKLVEIVAGRAEALGLTRLTELARTCGRVMEGQEPPQGFFASGRNEQWRLVLDALTALADPPSRGKASTRMLWSVYLDGAGGVIAIVPLEQKRGKRGWSKPREVPLSRLAKAAKLESADAAVARAVRRDRRQASQFHLNRAAAMLALVGHPRVILDGDVDRPVEVVRGSASLEVRRRESDIRLVMVPEPHELEELSEWAPPRDADEQREAEELRYVHVTEESPGRLRLIHINEGQRKVAGVLSGGVTVPRDAGDALDRTLQALTSQFQVHADRESSAAVTHLAESRLRAELAPAGEGLNLRLSVAPLGPEGPRLTPGRGRPTLMATVGGRTRTTRRDLEAETDNLFAVLDAVGFLDPPLASQLVAEWTVPDPELALSLLETLPGLDAVAGLDWPRGQPVRVLPVDGSGMTIRVRTERNWFEVEGGVAVDEGQALSFARMVSVAAASSSRFISMGDGVFAALTHQLRERVAGLAGVAEISEDTVRVPILGALVLQETSEGASVESDEGFRDRLDRLDEARTMHPEIPAGLETGLRPYQEEGVMWALRLAHAGFGAILADDMGLGKTIQAMAVLLDRAEEGPSLVVAPTSVCGNWVAEIRRFAPRLSAVLLGTADREGLLKEAGAGTVVIASYTLLALEQERLAGVVWSTIVADEAQAVKNARAQRTLALHSLEGGFRLALSGTPIENRLSELRSIMEFANPGLLGSPARFNERFAIPVERDGNRDAQRRLRRLVAPFVLRRTKAEVLHDLPDRTELELHVEAGEAEVAHYEALRRTALADAEAGPGEKFHILTLLMRLRRAACDPRLVTPTFPTRGAKVEAFGELARELVDNGHRALVFSQFVDFLALLKEPLDDEGIGYQYLDGSTPAGDRQRRVEAFQRGEGHLFLISLKAGGFGLNLTAADYVVITDPWWNPAAEDQAMGRAHRIGQERPVTAYRLVRPGTLEERILELHRDKRALAEGILSEDVGAAVLPSAEEMVALIRG